MPRGRRRRFRSSPGFGGQRLAYLDTTPEAHAVDQPVYKVQIHPPGAHFARRMGCRSRTCCIATTTAGRATARIRCCTSPPQRMAITSCACATCGGLSGPDYAVPADGAATVTGFHAERLAAESQRAARRPRSRHCDGSPPGRLRRADRSVAEGCSRPGLHATNGVIGPGRSARRCC